ncbi:MAG: DUF485 domain-containing protein [Rhodococcus sp. (in: high G+C Gram-positive bacteria)]|uniref:DUF485 domain-containing protein n=1 Tax=Rhodococcus sp. TaxID=1831 RepID=UPI0012128151|nr:DUF485 domain-containing protein [Rhodococcus sp. (in: high G+C Gram-positive bacteria)]RZL24638.1 MAG: DUF485 domain-containing protein [Rhodococcus sp. (in: high G+C Gram-positive bacteria)]
MLHNDTGVDWSRLWSDSAMLRLRRDRRRFFTTAWTIFGTAFGALVGAAAFAPDLVATRPVHGLSVGLMLSGLYVITVMCLGAWYVRRARHWDHLAAAVLQSPAAAGSEVSDNV